MCGRGRCTLRADDVARVCRLNNNNNNRLSRTIQIDRYQPRFNVLPGSYLPVLRRDDGDGGGGGGGGAVAVHCMKWGLVPGFTNKNEKPDHFKMFNARSESIIEKPSFRRLIPNNRCLVAMEGFYEWKKDGSKKQPYYIHFKDERPLVFAALYDSWTNSEGEVLYTFTILTTSSSSALQWLHDRMPVILSDESSVEAWLSGSASSKLNAILKPYEDSDLVWYPVTPAMGKTSFEGPECIKEVQLKEENNLISKFFSKKTGNPPESSPPPHVETESEGSALVHTINDLKREEDDESREITKCHDLQEDNDNLKPSVSSYPHQEEANEKKHGTKRDSDQLTLDSKILAYETKKPTVSASNKKKKKGDVKNTGDNQLTLFSYFGKG
ncbi:hypothetical protein Scep_029144 [Stephania cephalantha]|uniref:Embryonic stem cell-specific 5-hydroxymethylcytosine-binding protein n=1 Tax=Stephania cephalantha TaxID=152367 RepID=A0AAP0E4S4_9MAGN